MRRRRMLLVVTAVIIGAVGFGAQTASAAAQRGVLYGITFPAVLASINPTAGSLSPVVSLASVGPNPLVAALAPDEDSPNLSALVGTCTVCPGPRGGGPVSWQIAQVDAQTKTVGAGAQLQRPLAASIAFDPTTNMVWGVVDCAFPCASESVLMVDPSTGSETDAATLPVLASFAAFVALAPKTHTLYVVAIPGPGSSQLFAVNTVTKTVTAGPSIGQGITGLAVDPSNSALFALRGGAQSTVERIDPVTGTATVLASFAGGLGFATIDPRTHTLFAAEAVFVGNFHETAIVAVDEHTGSATEGTPINATVVPLAFLEASKR